MSTPHHRQELSAFLKERRHRLDPETVGLPKGLRRRTPGLRREEVALLAGVGTTWYTWLEQGRDIRVSSQVLDSIARVLQLSHAERAYLFDLVRDETPPHQEIGSSPISSVLQTLLDSQQTCPCYILNWRWDILAWNQLFRSIIMDLAKVAESERNLIWLTYMNDDFRERYVHWEVTARSMLAYFRASCVSYVGKPELNDLIQQLRHGSSSFREHWDRMDVAEKSSTLKTIRHPTLGEIQFETVILHLQSLVGTKLVFFVPLNLDPEIKL